MDSLSVELIIILDVSGSMRTYLETIVIKMLQNNLDISNVKKIHLILFSNNVIYVMCFDIGTLISLIKKHNMGNSTYAAKSIDKLKQIVQLENVIYNTMIITDGELDDLYEFKKEIIINRKNFVKYIMPITMLRISTKELESFTYINIFNTVGLFEIYNTTDYNSEQSTSFIKTVNNLSNVNNYKYNALNLFGENTIVYKDYDLSFENDKLYINDTTNFTYNCILNYITTINSLKEVNFLIQGHLNFIYPILKKLILLKPTVQSDNLLKALCIESVGAVNNDVSKFKHDLHKNFNIVTNESLKNENLNIIDNTNDTNYKSDLMNVNGSDVFIIVSKTQDCFTNLVTIRNIEIDSQNEYIILIDDENYKLDDKYYIRFNIIPNSLKRTAVKISSNDNYITTTSFTGFNITQRFECGDIYISNEKSNSLININEFNSDKNIFKINIYDIDKNNNTYENNEITDTVDTTDSNPTPNNSPSGNFEYKSAPVFNHSEIPLCSRITIPNRLANNSSSGVFACKSTSGFDNSLNYNLKLRSKISNAKTSSQYMDKSEIDINKCKFDNAHEIKIKIFISDTSNANMDQ